jgi:3-hydroxypropanoate dehydrogenase
MTKQVLPDPVLDQLFRQARSHNGWQAREVTDAQLQQIYDLMKMGPTSVNSCPARLVFIKSREAKERLKDCLNEGNVTKSMTAPVVVLIGMDLEFYTKLNKLWPHQPEAPNWYIGKPDKIKDNVFRNSTLQGAYFIMAVRSLGLDAGPMTGFNFEKMDATFFSDGKVKSNFICAIGYGDDKKLYPRGPRLDFDEACQII